MVKAIPCPNCSGTVTLKYSQQSLTCVCPFCYSVLSNDNESLKVVIKAQKKFSVPIIEMGKRYHFQGHEWELIGYLLRSDRSENYKWNEYLLFNPFVGFRFLVCMDGHWSYVIKTKSAPKVDTILNKATYLNKDYKLFHRGKVKTLFVLGEFYWKIKANEIVDAVDYINPPEMLSMEKDADEEIWSIGQYIPRNQVEKAFKLVGKMPLDVGVAPHQPSPHVEEKKMKSYVSYFMVILFMLHFGFVAFIFKNHAFNMTYSLTEVKGYKLQTESFTITDKPGYLESEINAPISNSWFEVLVELVNEDTGEEYEFDQGVEYYWGSDSDGSWTEGSQSSERRIARVPPGKYHMNISTDAGNSGPLSFTIRIAEGQISWGNFIFAIILLGIYPLYYLTRSRNFEKSRWSQSDYSPYWSESDD